MSRTSKVLIFLLLGVVIVLGGIWIYGNKKLSYETRLTIAAPPAYVFGFLADLEERKNWVDGLVEISAVVETDEVAGRKSKVIIEQDGTAIGFNNELIRYSKDSAISIRSSNASVVNTLVFNMKELKSGSTELTYRFHVVNAGLGKVLNIFFNRSDRQAIISEEARKLKSLIEERFQEEPNRYPQISDDKSPDQSPTDPNTSTDKTDGEEQKSK